MTNQGNEAEFLEKAEALLRAVEHCCDQINDYGPVDIDNQRTGGMLTLQFTNALASGAKGAEIVINLQKPLHEVWMAAPAGGFHYRLVADPATHTWHWCDTKTGSEFFKDLSRLASQLAGQPLQFNGAV
jgi:CyaY protein